MSANTLRLDQLRREYKKLVEARKFDDAMDVLDQVSGVYHNMMKAKEPLPAHFLDPGDDLL